MWRLFTMILRKFRLGRVFSFLIKFLIALTLVFLIIHLKVFQWKQSQSYVHIEYVNTTHVRKMSSCKMNMKYLPSHVTEFHDVILHPELAIGIRKGGEAIADVKGQSEEDEYFRFKHGFLNVSCEGVTSLKGYYTKIRNRFQLHKTYISEIIDAVVTSKYRGNTASYRDIVEGLTVGICRTDYANMYWTLVEIYSAYMTAKEMNRSSQETTILIMDAHPRGHLDDFWTLIFKKIIRVGWLDKAKHFEDFALAPSLKMVPIVRKVDPIPYFSDFRDEICVRVGGLPSRKINCEPFSITLILRKDYIAHPRNMEGKTKRQLANSEEISKALKVAFPKDRVRTVSFETLSVNEQVRISTETDLLIGVHGAGLAHTVFQAPGAGLIELFPYEYKRMNNPHVQELAEWSGKSYTSWYSDYSSDFINVPPHILTDKVAHMRKKICKLT